MDYSKNKLAERISVKCKEYYWGFCKLTKEECTREKCDKWRLSNGNTISKGGV
jgi:hypothetical protein